jgi:TolB protein
MSVFIRLMALVLALGLAAPTAQAQNRTFKIDVTGGISEPLPIATPFFVANNQTALKIAQDMNAVITANLINTGLFREIPKEAHISGITDFEATPQFADWKAINAQALTTGSVSLDGSGRLVVQFRLWDVFAETAMGEGLQFAGGQAAWRRIAHKVSDAIYARLTGETGYFDSRVVFVSESGPKDDRKKRLAIMDQDGANVQFLTDAKTLVLAPRFSPTAKDILFTTYSNGKPQVNAMNVDTGQRRSFPDLSGMSFAPRFAPDGQTVALSITQGSNTDIYKLNLSTGASQRLTNSPAIETAPSFSPDGSQIVFESDRGGSQQLYVMSANGGEARRISFGKGRYGTPVWSPRGDLVAFTKMQGGRFHIGVMRLDGSQERLLTASFLDEGPTWAPNGRVLMFFRESPGANGAPQLYSVDVSGRNLRRINTPDFASDPAWSGLLK